MQNSNELLSVQQATAKFPVHSATIRRWYGSGILPFITGKKSKVLFKESDLVKILTDRGFLLEDKND